MKIIGLAFVLVLSWSHGSDAAAIVESAGLSENWSYGSDAVAIAGFTGPYAPENWTANPSGAVTFSTIRTDAFSLAIYSSGATLFSVTVFETGPITFDWSARNLIYLGGNVEASVSSSLSKQYASIREGEGTKSVVLDVVAGEVLTFIGRKATSVGGGYLYVSNFQAGAIPEPSALGVIATGALGLMGFRRRRSQSS